MDTMSYPKTPVDSSNVKDFAYDDKTKVLTVDFLNNSTYEYFDVPKSVGAAARFQESPGKFIWQVMRKNGFAYKRIK